MVQLVGLDSAGKGVSPEIHPVSDGQVRDLVRSWIRPTFLEAKKQIPNAKMPFPRDISAKCVCSILSQGPHYQYFYYL